MTFSLAMSFHEGEEKMHKLLHVPVHDNPTATTLTPNASFLLQRAPLLAIGALDVHGRPWTSLWGGQPGFSQSLGGGIIGTRTIVDGVNDPVVQALVGGAEKGEMVQDNTKMFSGLTIDLMARKRVKIFGRMVAGSVSEINIESEEDTKKPKGAPDRQDQIQLVTKVEQSLGNCPKYLNQYEIRPALVNSRLISQSSGLSAEMKEMITSADMFFLSSSTPADMDTNHRGGPPGFVRILSSTEIIYPEYSGNRLYQTLGNLQMNPRVGITFPNYDNGDILYITGTAEVLVAVIAAGLLPGSNLALRITVAEARLVTSGLPFRGTRKIASPYNPLVRKLATEGNIKSVLASSNKMATLVKKTTITPSIARFTFSVPEGIEYKSGQWIALDFKRDLDYGYSHMRNDDPQSLNDDFVRTFTISSAPNSEVGGKTFDLTLRRIGPVTSYLFRQNERAGFEVSILGIGGDFHIVQEDEGVTAFVAGGLGITPLLCHLHTLALDSNRLKLFWTAKLSDVGLVLDIMQQYCDLVQCTEVYLTGTNEESNSTERVTALEDLGLEIKKRRISKSDLEEMNAETWYLCAGRALRIEVLGWLNRKKVVSEDFDY